ncbi:gamma-glutamyltransferase family protein [Kluyvera sp. STS39-E]|uniref:gamma-glutamyltransferase family protein n=1 Tax=Kluyvera sp. STS39-E TaxID=3234748 RepID=UPI0034C6A290
MTQYQSARCMQGMAVAPHSLAAESAVAVLRDGGNAIEAMVAAAATIAVVYPHMNGIGGDGFWLISSPGKEPVAIQACGFAAEKANIAFYQQAGYSQIPVRGPLAANTVAGTVSGWEQALAWAEQNSAKAPLPLPRLLKDAVHYARHGVPVSPGLHQQIASRLEQLRQYPGFSGLFAPAGEALGVNELLFQPALANTLERLAGNGLGDFYHGETARLMSAELEAAGSLLRFNDLDRFSASQVKPLALHTDAGTVYNLPPPSQGLVSLLITGILEQQRKKGVIRDEADFVHHCVEATKLAFNLRDRHITDPAHMTLDPQCLLTAENIADLSSQIAADRALPWGKGRGPADTIWMGVIDGSGTAVSFIQSIYHEFGSAVILPDSGVIWQNRGSSFSLDPKATNPLQPGRLPFHTLNPALARLTDGGLLVYGSMGGDGQPQTLAAVFDRIVNQNMTPQAAITAPRWLLGRTWGESSDTLKIESRLRAETTDTLKQYGHDVEIYPPYDDLMGHAGAILRHRNGMLEGGSDPRSDGGVARW